MTEQHDETCVGLGGRPDRGPHQRRTDTDSPPVRADPDGSEAQHDLVLEQAGGEYDVADHGVTVDRHERDPLVTRVVQLLCDVGLERTPERRFVHRADRGAVVLGRRTDDQ